jgi:hypothetical protein
MMMAGPLTGAPGAVLLHALVGLGVWSVRRPGGLLGVRGARTAWTALWLFMAWLWLGPQNSSPGAVAAAINTTPSGIGWLSSVQHWAATDANGNGHPIALVLAQGFGGIFTGSRTDPNSAPLFILFAWVLYALSPRRGRSVRWRRTISFRGSVRLPADSGRCRS